MREHLNVDARLIHFLHAQCRVIEQAFHDVRGAAHRIGGAEMGGRLFVPVVLFDGNDFRLGGHVQCPLVRKFAVTI